MNSATISDNKKTRGRPKTGVGSLIGLRWQPAELALIDAWRRQQPDLPSRSEAIRQLVHKAIAGSNSTATAALANTPAGIARSDAKQIDRLENEGGETDAPTRSDRREAAAAKVAKDHAVKAVREALGKVDAPIGEKIERGKKLVKRPPGLERK